MKQDGSSDTQTFHWGNHFKRLHREVDIENNTLKMTNNNLRLLHRHHLLQHGSRNFPYFDFDNTNFVKDRIKGIPKKKMDKIEVKIKEVMKARRNFLDAYKKKRSDTIVKIAYV